MAYQYDGNGGFQPEEKPQNGKKNDNDFGAWLLIGIMFLVAWPVGLILLISKLTDNPKKVKKAVDDTAQHLRDRAQEVQSAEKKRGAQSQSHKTASQKVTKTPQPSIKGAKALKVIGIVLAALGGLSVFYTAGVWLDYAISYSEWWYFLRQMFYPVGLLAGGVAMLLGSRGMKKRMRRFGKYLACAGERQAIPLSHLAKAADVRESRAEQDIEQMIEKGMWGPDAYFDGGSDMLFRSQAAASAYFAEKRTGERQTASAAAAAAAPQPEGYAATLLAIRRANDRIDDEVLSAKIDRLEAVTGQIFRVIEEKPAKKAAAGTFLNYYLPTTQKLLDNYADFEEAGISGENLDQAKARIEETMDNIIAGFEHQLDELYRDTAMDIDSDIRVMETMLRRDTASAAEDFGLGGGTAVQMPDAEIE